MRLGVLLPHTKLYGGVKRFLELGNIFVAKGHDFCVFTPDGKVPDWFDFHGRMATFGDIDKEPLDALWTTTVKYVPMLAQSGARHKIFYHVRIRENMKEVLAFPGIEVYACSSNVYENDVRRYGIELFKAFGGVTLANYPVRNDYSCDGRPFVVMAYGRLAERVKGTKYVVRACSLLHLMGVNVRLLLFESPTTEKAAKKIRRFKCICPHEFVLNHPFDRNHELFARADCFVSAENPKYSGWNNTVAEAMACGMPVVSTSAGTKDLLTDGVNGLLSARWVLCFARQILRLRRDEQLRRTLGQNARRHIERFDWERVAENIINHLQ